jgi:hypothetical protein
MNNSKHAVVLTHVDKAAFFVEDSTPLGQHSYLKRSFQENHFVGQIVRLFPPLRLSPRR